MGGGDRTLRRVCVFCGSNPGGRPDYAAAAREMGRVLVERGLGLVYGGGNVGLMGIVADTVLAGGGEVVGVIPEALMAREVGHAGLTELHVVRTMHERKAMMADRADAFVAMPGGFGTFEEFCEVLTWSQLGFHPKPCGLLNVAGYYDPLLALFDRGAEEGFIPPQHRALVIEETDPARLLDRFAAFRPPTTSKWIRPDER
ncbi:MAG TPA: TIGR00730 family Rossman fold protein [Longimicrobium sp.]